MNHALLADTGWAALRARLPPDLDLDASARDHGALRRRRGVGGADALLRLALIYGTTPLSLRTTAAWAEVGDLGHLSDVALLDRLRGAEAWLGAVLGALLGAALPASARPAAVTGTRHRRVLLADATALPPPGGRPGIARRVHASFDLGRRRFDHLELTDGSGGGSEGLHRCPASAGAIVVADRFYAKATGLHHLAGAALTSSSAAASRAAPYAARTGASSTSPPSSTGSATGPPPTCRCASRGSARPRCRR